MTASFISLCSHKKNYDQAQKYFDSVLQINPAHISCMHQKARMLVAKYAAKSDLAAKSGAQDVLDAAFKVYEGIIQISTEVQLRYDGLVCFVVLYFLICVCCSLALMPRNIYLKLSTMVH